MRRACRRSDRAEPMLRLVFHQNGFPVLRLAWFGRCLGLEGRLYPVQPRNMRRKAFAGKQRHGLVEWQTGDRGIGPNKLLRKCAGKALDSTPPGLPAPLARSEIGFDLGG